MTFDPTFSAEALVAALVDRDVAAVRAQFDGPGDIDDPAAGRQIDGGFQRLVENWAPVSLAELVGYEVRHVTVGLDRRFSATEIHLDLRRANGPKDLDIVVVSEFTPNGGLVRSRFYYRLARLTGVQHQRTRILPEEPVHLEPFSPIVDEYQRALRAGDTLGQTATFTENGVFDGHGESQDLRDGVGMGHYEGRAAIQSVLEQMFEIGDEEASFSGEAHIGTNLEKLNIISDGTTTVVEFNIIHVNHPLNRLSAGVAAYEVGEDGLLKEARIYDEAW